MYFRYSSLSGKVLGKQNPVYLSLNTPGLRFFFAIDICWHDSFLYALQRHKKVQQIAKGIRKQYKLR